METCGAAKVAFTGGEFFLHPSWKDILESTTLSNIYILTNGMAITTDDINWINNYKLKRMRNEGRPILIGFGISLDGLEGHNRQRDYNFVDVIRLINRLKNAGFIITVNTVITNELIARELIDLYDIIIKLGVHRWQLAIGKHIENYCHSDLAEHGLKHLENSKTAIKIIVERYLKTAPDYPFKLEIEQLFRSGVIKETMFVEHNTGEHPCAYENGSAIVEDGDELKYCALLKKINFGKIMSDNSDSATRSNVIDNFLNMKISDTKCADCRYVKIQGGGCRASALSWTGDILEKDPVCCALSPFLEENIVPMLPVPLQKEFHRLIVE